MRDRRVAITGRAGAGKTSLMVGLVGALTGRGLKVSTIMAANAEAAIDRPGKDSYRHRDAGADEVMVTSAQRWALIHGAGESRRDPLAQMTDVDVVLCEDVDCGGGMMIEVHRAATGDHPLACADAAIAAVVSDGPVADLETPRLDLADLAAVADFIVARLGLHRGA